MRPVYRRFQAKSCPERDDRRVERSLDACRRQHLAAADRRSATKDVLPESKLRGKFPCIALGLLRIVRTRIALARWAARYARDTSAPAPMRDSQARAEP